MKPSRLLKTHAARIVAILCVLVLLGGAGLYVWLCAGLPAPDDLSAYTSTPSSKIYDRYGQLLFEMPPPYTGSHTPVTLDAIPPYLIHATIATEDATFYSNPGMDLRGILRAVWMTPEEIRASADRHRSPLVWQCVADCLAGRRYPLELITHHG